MDEEFEKAAAPVEEEPDGEDAYAAATETDELLPEHILPEPGAPEKYRLFGRSDPLDEEEMDENYAGEWYPTRRVLETVADVYGDMNAVGREYDRTYTAEGSLELSNDKATSYVIRPGNAETLIDCGYTPKKSQFTISSEDEQVKIWLGYYPADGGAEGAFRAGATLEDVSLDEVVAVRDVLWDRVGAPAPEESR